MEDIMDTRTLEKALQDFEEVQDFIECCDKNNTILYNKLVRKYNRLKVLLKSQDVNDDLEIIDILKL